MTGGGWRELVRLITAALIVTAAFWAFTTLRGSDGADESDYEMHFGACEVSPYTAVANGTITNTSSRRRAFDVTVRFSEPDGNLVSQDTHSTATIRPGRATSFTVRSSTSDPLKDTKCELVHVDDQRVVT